MGMGGLLACAVGFQGPALKHEWACLLTYLTLCTVLYMGGYFVSKTSLPSFFPSLLPCVPVSLLYGYT